MSKKILHIIDNLGLGGAQICVKGIFEKQDSNVDIFLFSIRKMSIRVNIDHSNIIENKTKNKFSFPLLSIKKIIKQNNIDTIHCHLAKSQIMGALLKILFFPKIKLVFHEHGEIFEEAKIYPFLMNLFRKKVDIYIAVSNATKQKILEKTKFKESKIKLLYNFVDLDKFKKIKDFDLKAERKKYGLDKDDFVLGFASRLYEAKGYIDYLEAAKILIDKGYNFKFLIAGEGKDKEKIIEYILNNRLQNNIKYIGYIKKMNNFYNTIDCFIFPSHRESLGLTGIEANACGVPVIASNIEGLNEIMINNKNVLQFEKQSVGDLVKKIEKIYKDSELREKLIENGLKEVKKYSLKKYLTKLNEIYE
ncbi:MAG: glycosyltransferase family 4 protein [Candidatus Gracilibacteria bacterium]|nr:glycosyltransferase family 4 protein [Candidatus Gracilibacteria bacterium]